MKKDYSKVVEYYLNMHVDQNVNVHYLHRLIRFIKYLCIKYPSTKKRGTYDYPTHHIIPRSWGGSNDNENLLTIPHRAHYIIHWIMYRAFPVDNPMRMAFYLMSHSMGGKYTTSREFCSLQERTIEYMKLNSQFIDRVPVINLITGEFELIDKSIYKCDTVNYKHVTKDRKNSPETIQKMKLAFSSGQRVSKRKNKVMAKHIVTGDMKLVDIDFYYSTDEWVGISTGTVRTEEHKMTVSNYMKTFKKTDVQKQSAKKMIEILQSKKITCDCCGKSFNPGNYKKHKMYKSDNWNETKKVIGAKIREAQQASYKKYGTWGTVYMFKDGDESFISYDYNFMLNYFDISCHTMKRRYNHKKVAMHRNRKISKRYVDIRLEDYPVLEDVCGI